MSVYVWGVRIVRFTVMDTMMDKVMTSASFGPLCVCICVVVHVSVSLTAGCECVALEYQILPDMLWKKVNQTITET